MMEESRDYRLERITELEEAIKALPVKLQNALFWAVENYEALQEMGRKSEMTLEEIQIAIKDALAAEEYAMLLLLFVTESMKQSNRNEEF